MTAGIGLALGAGGARGLGHLVLLEALDELGVRPAAVAGTSIGAIVGAPYAAGLSGRELRQHVLRVFGRRPRALALLMEARVGRFAELLRGGLANPVLVDAERVLGGFWPPGLPDDFAGLAIPFTAVATDFHGRAEVAISSGPLRSAVAASMAMPGLVRPVERDGLTLVDGAATDPLPYGCLPADASPVVASDVVTGPFAGEGEAPTPFQAMFGSAQIMQAALTARTLRGRPPDLLVRPPVGAFKVLDFFRFARILDAADAEKDAIKRRLEAMLDPPGR